MPNNLDNGFTLEVRGQTAPTTSGNALAQVSVFTTPRTAPEEQKRDSSQAPNDKIHALECRLISVEKDIESYKTNIPVKEYIEFKSDIKQIKKSRTILWECIKFFIPTIISICSLVYAIFFNNGAPK